jgi:murein DD-endopeptidase MepM/ murein hydrolase activator NlpD
VPFINGGSVIKSRLTPDPDTAGSGRGNENQRAAQAPLRSAYRRRYLHGVALVIIVSATLFAVWPGSRAILSGDLAAETPSPRQQSLAQFYRDGYLRALPLITTEAALRPMEALAASLAPDKPKPAAEAVVPAEVSEPEAQSDEGPSGQPPPQPEPTPEPVFLTYTVQTGDTVAAIAAAHGIQAETLLWNNPDLSADPDAISIGQQLLIPSRDGILYTVTLGDTLTDIADLYEVQVENIVGFISNEIGSPDSVSEGALLLLPGAVPPPPPPPAATPEPIFAAGAPEPSDAGTIVTPDAVSVTGFAWPVYGPISEYYGAPRGAGTYHAGLDIDQTFNYGGPIAAAAPGQVVLATSDGYGYGSYVIIRHDNGYETLYAHMSAIYVSQGQYVSQGEAIGAIGCTGYCTGPHLHFEVRVGGATVDPLAYLP